MLDRLLRGALLALGLLCPLVVLLVGTRSFIPFPEPDFMKVLADAQAHGLGQALWVQIEGHRMVVPRLLLLADFHGFGGGNLLTAAAVFAVQAALAALAARAALAVAGLPGAALTAALALGPYYTVFCAQQHGWVTVVHGLCVAAIACFWRGLGEGRRLGWMAAALVLSLAASFSGLPGILAWPVMVFLALAGRCWRALAVPVLGVALFVPLFRIGMAPTHGGGEVLSLLAAPWHTGQGLALHVGALVEQALFFQPLAAHARLAALLAGLAGLAAAAMVLLRLVWRPGLVAGQSGLLAGLLLLAVLWLAAAVGKHGQPGAALVVHDRFLPQSGWFWAMLGVLLLQGWGQGRQRLGAVLVLAVLAGLVPMMALKAVRADAEAAVNRVLLAGVLAGVDDPELRGARTMAAAGGASWRLWPPVAALPAAQASVPCGIDPLAGERVLPQGGRMLWGRLPAGAAAMLSLDARGGKSGAGVALPVRPWVPAMTGAARPAMAADWVGYETAAGAVLAFLDQAGRPLCRWPSG